MKQLVTSILAIILATFSAQAQRSEGTAVANLEGRSTIGNLPRLTTTGKVEGTVVVSITVDPSGSVVDAIAGAEGSTITNNSVLNAVRSAALRAHFSENTESSALQSGTISYTFVSSSLVMTEESTLKFMGIPIDGPKDKMIEALKAKGFEQRLRWDDYVTGIFNGERVRVNISTNHGIVDMLTVEYPHYSEDNDTRIKYNTLLSRFNRNAKYVCVSPRVEIPSDEDIDWMVNKNTKYYDAVYFFLHPEINAKPWLEEFKQEYQKFYKKPLEGVSYEEMEEALFCLPMKVSSAVSGVVWFTIDGYNININYVNLSNRPKGEDL